MDFEPVGQTSETKNFLEENAKEIKKWKDEEFRKIRLALFNILEDTEEARKDAVREKNRTLTMLNNLTDGILVLDPSHKIELINPLAEAFLKKDKKEFLGKNIFKISSPRFSLAPFFQALKSGKKGKIKNILQKEVKLGEKIFVEVSTVFLGEENESKGVLIILHDVSRDKLVETMKTEFVSIAAHQLRTPLSAIKWTIRMLLDGDIGDISEDQKSLLEKTYESNERMIGLINDLLNVTRIEEGRFLYKPEISQIEDLTDKIIKNSEGPLAMKKIKIKLEKPRELLPSVLVDEEKMGLAIQNLLENAIKYTSEKGTITISLQKEKNYILFKIKDTGVGIPLDQQDRIFTKFFRGSNVVKMETDGSGLGLYTTKNIIEAHNGKIWFESEEGKGTLFCFTLPIFIKNN
jgi:PAS domain S-box-containing protein